MLPLFGGNFAVFRAHSGGRTATLGHGEWYHDVFLFDGPTWSLWAVAVMAVGLSGWPVRRLLKQRRRRRQLRRRREIRARLCAAAPVAEINLTDPAREIDLRDRVVYGSEITLESGETLESGIVGPSQPD